MVYDSQEGSQPEDRWKKAFRMTIRKCLLGTVIGATGTRAIYFTVQVMIVVVLCFAFWSVFYYY